MMSNLLALLGSLTLASAAVMAGFWASDVSSSQPDLPETSGQADLQMDTGKEQSSPSSRRQRPDIFYTATIERPIFSPDRRPSLPQEEIEEVAEQSVVAPVAETPIPRPKLDLLGVMGSNAQNRALITHSGGEAVWIDENTQIAGWTVKRIGSDWLELTLDTETIRIEMYQQ